MTKLLSLLLVAVVCLSACKKETANTPEPPVTPPAGASFTHRGVFSDGPYGTTSGVAKVYNVSNTLSLELDSFAVNNGPDLHVYLSREVQPINFIDLGRLKANSGKQSYAIAGMPNLADYKFVLIHCQRFDHLFGQATLTR
jgi:hypothetical protein